MLKRRKRRAANIQQLPPNVPAYYPYPSYEYAPPPPVHNPAYAHPTPAYQPTNYIFYPVDEYGQMLGPPALLPPIQNRSHQQPDPYREHHSNRSANGSYKHPPIQNQRPLDEDHNQPPQQSHRSYEKPRYQTLPPINRNPFASTRPISPNNEEYQQFAVRDLTERGSASSRLSHTYAIDRIQYYDQLQKNYH